ncbi:MAG: hypothetical protein H6867_02375 [Rhodospirillales bacterium]|nr:hypothetical protein [Rhodospirillales bacterium]MCB9997035.1 hypothetical protein [Rhodospirillales bacterium]
MRYAFYLSKQILPVTAFVFLLLFCLPTPALAYLERGKYTEEEKVGFAFHQMMGNEPDYPKWIEKKEDYQNALPGDRIALIKKDTMRLQNGFFNYQAKEDLFKISVPALIEVSNFYDESQKTGRETTVKITLQGIPEQSYFPIQVGDIWVAVIPKDFITFLEHRFNRQDYQDFAKRLRFDAHTNSKQANVNIDFTLRASSVDKKAPIMIENLEMWLMSADVAHMEMWESWGTDKKYLWEYQAPWYKTREEVIIMDLYRN